MQNETKKNNFMNWGKWIIVAFIMFAGFIATLVTVCMRQDISLVSKDYYTDELAYQEQIVRINNANALTEKPIITATDKSLDVDYTALGNFENGVIKLFRPSDPEMDKTFPLEASATHKSSFPIGHLAKGMYRARLQWRMNGEEYFIETVVNI
jgi:hypothetical protein